MIFSLVCKNLSQPFAIPQFITSVFDPSLNRSFLLVGMVLDIDRIMNNGNKYTYLTICNQENNTAGI